MATDDDQATRWNSASGTAWVELQGVLDGLFQPLEELLVSTLPADDDPTLLDIGCGSGGTTLAAASRLGAGAHCTGIDVSAPMIDAARKRAAQSNASATFTLADAQTHPFEPGSIDRLISRFGVMFFPDPVAAFANLRRAAKPDAAFTAIAWRTMAENPFMTVAETAAAHLLPDLPPRRPDGPGQFAFGDARTVESILAASGWTDIAITPIDIECTMAEPDLVPYFTRLGPVAQAMADVSDDLRDQIIETVRPAFEPYVRESTVSFVAACWMIQARAA